MPATMIPKKSALSTEVIRVPIRATINGAVVNPTSYVVSAAAVDYALVQTGVKRAPVPADFVTMTWETAANPARYWIAVLMGPAATLNPAGPSSSEAEKLYDLWWKIVAGSETVIRKASQFAVTP